ncbi:gastrula zinc finger protein xLCGF3.1-like [Austrofundulus limnaeus]|uniref:Gastrula zinc finger protein xLCGF3.1-like n=1 Tax=Austrofundulus limnaeus TaxID=52670 RepID=A0A2I4AX89_AUSLI|nr:PREDICTED: gastrula zinc finger protein xLCGF3.1-like [Austrofundulus limnaeus]
MDVKNSTVDLTSSPATSTVKEEPEDPNGDGFVQELLVESIKTEDPDDGDGFVQELLVESINTPFKPHCSKQSEECFGDSRDLELHKPKHTGERKFACTQCEKRFNQSGDLQKHQRVHTREKPFTCTQCEKRFTVSCNLKRHQCVQFG